METCNKTVRPNGTDAPYPIKGCGCAVGFCRVETLLAALTREVMAGRNRPDLEAAMRAKQAECCGGFRTTKD